MKNYLRFLSPVLLLLAVLMGGGKIYATEITVTQTTFTATSANNINGDKNVSYSTAQGGGTAKPIAKNGQIYLYQNANGTGGGTITIKSISTAKIKSVTIGSSMGTKVAYTLDGSKNKSTTTDLPQNEKYTASGLNANSVTFYCMGDNKNARLYVNYLSVTYENAITTSISFPTTSYSFDLGSGLQEFTNAATLTPSEAGSVNYSVDKEWVDIDNGFFVVQTDEAGTATVTASFAGNESYAESSATFTINVVKPEIVEDGIFDFSGNLTYGSGVEKTSDGNFYIKEDRTWRAGNVKMVTSGKYRLWKNTNGLRFYGGKLTLSVPDGYIITNVILTGTEAFDVDCGTLNGLKWIGVSPSIVFTSNNNGMDLTSITVKYTKLESLTPAASGYATYAADYAVNYSEQGLTVYAVKVATDNSKVSATPFTGVVPAGKAVLVKGTAGQKYTLTPATTAADETFDTDLQASDGTVTADGAQHFAFGTKNGESGFKLVKSGVVIPAKKGYLLISNAGAKEFFAFEGETTGISVVETAPAADGNVYNMAGQRVSKNYKGLVIVGGKKYLNK